MVVHDQDGLPHPPTLAAAAEPRVGAGPEARGPRSGAGPDVSRERRAVASAAVGSRRSHVSQENAVLTALAAVGALGIAAYAAGAGSVLSGAVGIWASSPTASCAPSHPENPCVTPEELQQWTVHGVEAVEAGPGLVGGSLGGIASIRVDPALIEQANAGRIFAGFDDGPYLVNGLSRRLTLPPGAYSITAKLTVTSQPVTRNAEPARDEVGQHRHVPAGGGRRLRRVPRRRVRESERRRDEDARPEPRGRAPVRRRRRGRPRVRRRASTSSVRPSRASTTSARSSRILKIVAIRATSLSNHSLG